MRLFGVSPAVAAAIVVILMSQAQPAERVPGPEANMAQLTTEQKLLGPLADIRDPEGHGSGFFVSPEIVVTAAHVIEGLAGRGAYVLDNKGAKHRVVESHLSYDGDVGVIVVDNPDPNQVVAKVKCEMPIRFQTLVAAGHPLTVNNVTSPQMVVGWDDTRDVDDVVSLVLSGDIDPGMSGGPIYNLDGEVVAVVSNRTLFEIGEGVALSAFNRAVPLVAVQELCPPPAQESEHPKPEQTNEEVPTS